MLYSLNLVIGLFILACIIVRSRSMLFVIRVFGVYVLLSITILVIPYFFETSPTTWLFESLLHMMKSMVLNNDSTIAHFFAQQALPYGITLYAFYVLAPLFTLGVSLTLFEKQFASFFYHIASRFKPSVIFSEFNSRTKCIGEHLRKQNQSILLVYLAGGNEPIDYTWMKEFRATVLFNHDFHFHHSLRYKRELYLLSTDDLKNIRDAIDVINEQQQRPQFNNLHLCYRGEAPKLVFKRVMNGLTVDLINEEELVVNDLIRVSPLFEAVNSANEFTAIVIGLGKLGRQVLKQICVHSLVSSTVKRKIYGIDSQAESIKQQILLDAPELFNYEPIEFKNVDVCSNQLRLFLKSLPTTPTYIVLALSEQQLSIETAIFIRRYFETYERNQFPLIHIALDQLSTKINLVDKMEERFHFKETPRSYDFKTFGIYDEIYRQYIQDSRQHEILEESFIQTINPHSDELEPKNYRSFILQLPTYLDICGFYSELSYVKPPQENELNRLKEAITQNLDELTKIDDLRWTTFKRTEGFTRLSLHEIQDGCYQYFMKKQHAMLGFNEDEMKAFASKMGYDLNFIVHSIQKMFLSIPDIINIYNDNIEQNNQRFVSNKIKNKKQKIVNEANRNCIKLEKYLHIKPKC